MSQPIEHTDLTIRRATRADLPAIVRLLADDPLGKTRERDEEPLPQTYYTAFAAIDADPRNELVVVEATGEVVGTLQLTLLPYLTYQGGTRAQIEAVRVDRRYRSHGVGQQLFAWAIERARAAGCHLVQLTTNASRDDAHRFYARLGFVSSHVGMKLDLTPGAAVTSEKGTDSSLRSA
jgi:GNAT superfamily N-acetyltransferase